MGYHYFKDTLTTDSTLSWNADNLQPGVLMYDSSSNLNAFFIASAYIQVDWTTTNEWEPISLPTYVFCQNTCDADTTCTFDGTDNWSTMHFYLNPVEDVKCSDIVSSWSQGTMSCTVSGVSCCGSNQGYWTDAPTAASSVSPTRLEDKIDTASPTGGPTVYATSRPTATPGFSDRLDEDMSFYYWGGIPFLAVLALVVAYKKKMKTDLMKADHVELMERTSGSDASPSGLIIQPPPPPLPPPPPRHPPSPGTDAPNTPPLGMKAPGPPPGVPVRVALEKQKMGWK
jgi:hypothetical protein